MQRYGVVPTYESTEGSSTRLLDLPLGDLDYDALAAFIRLGYFVGNTTAFRNIRHAGPEPWLTQRSNISRSSAIDIYGELFRSAVRNRMPDGEILLPLSGGRDSRHILYELIEVKKKPSTITVRQWFPHSNDDTHIARLLARRLGLDHRVVGNSWISIPDELAAHEISDFCSDELAWMLPIRDLIGGRPTFDGVAGDVLSAGLYLHPGLLDAMDAGDTKRATDLLFGNESVWRQALSPNLYKKLSRERASEVLCKELAKHLDAPNPVSSFLFWNRTRREIALFGTKILGNVRMPYLDDAVYDHLTSLPASYFLDNTFHTETINRMFPQFADIPYDSKGSTRMRRWMFRLGAVQVEVYRLLRRSHWVARSFLNLKTTPSDLSRVLYLLHLEQLSH